MKNKVSKVVKLVASALLIAGCAINTVTAEEKPNIIFILTDDLGFNQVGAYGDTPIKTPNLDAMAANGIRFDQAYAGNTVCSPSRVSLFTGRDGRYMTNNSNTVELNHKDITLAHVLKYADYDTALFGKYSIGQQMGVTDPLAMGFDTWYGMYSILEGHRQYPQILWRDGQKIRIKENEGGRKGAYAQELFTNEAIDYIKQERENPFFVMLTYSSPHAELAVPAKYSDKYKLSEKPYTGMKGGKPADKYAAYYPEPVDKPNATLAGMVSALDEYIGQILNTLDEQGKLENTLIIFTSDNGPHDEGGADPTFFKASAPYKGQKRDLYDGGIHVPMIVHWPAQIRTARVDQTPWLFADVLPTFADIADVNLNMIPRVHTNGVSIADLLNDKPVKMADRILYWEFSKQVGDPNSGVIGDTYQAARKGNWKAVRYGFDAPLELYNIIQDPSESNNLVRKNRPMASEFLALFERYKK
ncbi:sulfatase-like hydrolase/transferase [Psychrosphaera sp. B3R10]|uniref:sulfatase-like hydrolase/transferase n=1 Tax=unclassified Psychrosphaera TaxID=2641570 RepID=UPI001C0893AB|nr:MULTISPECIES: sulfatase-like hydrolase/transferase [unclassified Psychrosphaera]MBU2883544.1 sulfatase-like hydrolase/transferase [Psychrosphaera sp. I2R16]MBU2989723.1 sulfatase-like hydrolase/transferase [Psychrosphaera sp. B3R10]MDO6719822.1 sulfatase-like hydrolase/transferase [Psychrosphaera sp. 1_MG-2023]